MSFTSDNIATLSTNIPLTSLDSWTSEKVIAGQYSSLVIPIKTDQNATLEVQFSGDGINWDIIDTYPIVANTPVYETIIIFQKWIRLVLSNLGPDMSYLRVYTYGSVQNTNTNAVLISDIGNKLGDINVANFPIDTNGDLSTVGLIPVKDMQFNFGCQPNQAQTTVNPDKPIFLYEMDAYSSDDTQAYYMFMQDKFQILGNAASSGYFFTVQSKAAFPYRPGQGTIIRIGCILPHLSSNYSDYYIGIGTKNTSTAVINSGIFVGFSATTGLFTVYLFDGYDSPNPITADTSNFNIDKMDGTGNSGFILNETLLNKFEIEIDQGISAVIFKVYNPAIYEYMPFHIMYLANVSVMLKPQFYGGNMIIQLTKKTNAVQTGGSFGPVVANFSVFTQATKIYYSIPMTYSHGVACSTESVVFSLRNNLLFNGKYGAPVYINKFNFATESVNECVLFYVYKDCVITADWVYCDNGTSSVSRTSMQYSYNSLLSPGYVFDSYVCAPKGNIIVSLTEENQIILNPGQILTITAVCPSSASHYATCSWVHGY